MLWRLLYLDGGEHTVEADECRREGAWLVLRQGCVVVMEPRLVVVLRVRVADVHEVRRVEE